MCEKRERGKKLPKLANYSNLANRYWLLYQKVVLGRANKGVTNYLIISLNFATNVLDNLGNNSSVCILMFGFITITIAVVLILPSLLIPPSFLADFGVRSNIRLKGKYQISRYHNNSTPRPSFLSGKKSQRCVETVEGISMISTVLKELYQFKYQLQY